MIVFRVDYGTPYPVQVECEHFEAGERDADGETIYINTHFADSRAAWVKLLAEAVAGQRLATSAYVEAQVKLKQATEALARDAAFRATVEEAFAEIDTEKPASAPEKKAQEAASVATTERPGPTALILSMARDRWCARAELIGNGPDKNSRQTTLHSLWNTGRLDRIGERGSYEYRVKRMSGIGEPLKEHEG